MVLIFQVIPIVTADEDQVELTEEELAKRREFERKRKKVATPEGLDIKAVLGHRIHLPGGEEEDEGEDANEQEVESPNSEEAKVEGVDPNSPVTGKSRDQSKSDGLGN